MIRMLGFVDPIFLWVICGSWRLGHGSGKEWERGALPGKPAGVAVPLSRQVDRSTHHMASFMGARALAPAARSCRSPASQAWTTCVSQVRSLDRPWLDIRVFLFRNSNLILFLFLQ